MFSTYDGARKRAKDLKRLFDDSGFLYPLNKVQEAVAKAGGFADWHALKAGLTTARDPGDPAAYRRRLLGALPYPCRAPVQAWFDGELDDVPVEAGLPPRYFRDVFPYIGAATALHRQTPLLRPGSGAGQRLRESLVIGLLLNIHGGDQPWPKLDPVSLALVFEGDLASLYKSDATHPRFAEEFRRLQDAGILASAPGRVSVMPPGIGALIERVNGWRANHAEHWSEAHGYEDETADALRNALAGIGTSNARRVADAIARQGDAAYTTPSGAVLTLLTTLAEQGDLLTLARAYALFSKIHPTHSRYVRESVPVKILSAYFPLRLGLSATSLIAWTQRTPGWAAELMSSVGQPDLFVATVQRMAADVQAAA